MDTEEFNNFKNNCPYVKGLDNNMILYEYVKWKINDLKEKLSSTDYKAIKYAEGLYTDDEYKDIKIERQQLRDQINVLTKYSETIKNR